MPTIRNKMKDRKHRYELCEFKQYKGTDYLIYCHTPPCVLFRKYAWGQFGCGRKRETRNREMKFLTSSNRIKPGSHINAFRATVGGIFSRAVCGNGAVQGESEETICIERGAVSMKMVKRDNNELTALLH